MSVDDLKTKALALSDEDLQSFLQQVLEEMPVVRMNALVKHLEDTWDVSAAAAAPMMMAAAAGGAEDGGGADEQSEFDVILAEVGDSKLNVIKVIREVTGLGIKEAKALVDGAPKPVKEKVSKSESEEIKTKLVEAGAKVELK